MDKGCHAIKIDFHKDPKENKIVPLDLDSFHAVLSTIDGAITYAQQEKNHNILRYKKFNGNDFYATEKKGAIEINGVMTQTLVDRLEKYQIFIPEKIKTI